jgi:hypothetical protein
MFMGAISSDTRNDAMSSAPPGEVTIATEATAEAGFLLDGNHEQPRNCCRP